MAETRRLLNVQGVKTPSRVRISHLPRVEKTMTKLNKIVTIAIIGFKCNDIINKFISSLGKKLIQILRKKQ